MHPQKRPVRVAVACSGLGHVQRGIEAWARDLDSALGRQRTSIEVSLFAGAPLERAIAVSCWHRTGRVAKSAARVLAPLGGWRFGMGSTYEAEQTSFALSLSRHVRSDFDILHVQDAGIARFFAKARRLGLSRPRVLFANGTGEAPEVLSRFDYLQHLTPDASRAWAGRKPVHQRSYMIPNFINSAQFTSDNRRSSRERLGLPPDATVVLCCAAIRKTHKRIDYLLQEFSAARQRAPENLILVIAGGQEAETAELIAMARDLLSDSVRILVNVPRQEMSDLYAASDIFVLPSLFELFGIVLIEAMASGLPVLCHEAPNFRYVAGDGAVYRDFSKAGGLCDGILAMLQPEQRQALARRAQQHVRQTFDEQVVIPQIIQMYQDIAKEGRD